jgi:hypothetical protein
MFGLILLFGVMLAIYWFGFKDKTPPAEAPTPTAESRALVSLDQKSVQEIQWSFGSSKGTLGRVSDSEWKLIDPPISADKDKLSSFVSAIFALKGENTYPFAQTSKQETGLDSPLVTIRLKTKDGKNESILIGKQTVDGEYNYATRDGWDYSILLASYSVEDLKKDPYTLGSTPSTSPAASPL